MRKGAINYFYILGLVGLGVIAFIVLGSLGKGGEDDPYFREAESGYAIYQPYIPDSLSLAGEAVPLDRWYVREDFERELAVNMYWQSQTLLLLKRSNRFLPEARSIFAEMGVPEDLVYIALVESGLQNLTSPAGAKGYWQFMTATARNYNLEVNSEVEERYHFSKSTRAAARYLKEAHDRFGSWTLAAAAYNRGPDGLGRALDSQKVGSFFDLWLNEETSRYIYRILAMKCIMEQPLRYGFRLRAMDLYPELPVTSISISDTSIDLIEFAKEQGTTLRVLREYNPWLISSTLTAKTKEYEIQLPKGGDLGYPKTWFGEQNKHIIGLDTVH